MPERARWLRVLLAELERVYNHLHYLGHLSNTTTLKVGEAQGKLLEERAKQINARLTGSRFLRSLLTPGGLRRDLDAKTRGAKTWLSGELEALRVEAARYVGRLENSDSHLDRLITTGVLTAQVAFDQGATGPIQRASGADRDLRRDHPYAAYGELPHYRSDSPGRRRPGTCAGARGRARHQHRDHAARPVAVARRAGAGRLRASAASRGTGLERVARGSLFYAVHFGADGRLARVKIKSPSFSNWRVFPSTVHDSNMMDYAINEASFGLTIAGCAR